MSQLDSQTKTIGGHRFEVFKLAPLDAQDVLIDIGQALAPAIGKAANAIGAMGDGSPLDLDVDDPRISSGIAELMRNITKAKMRELINTMASVTHCDGTPLPKTMEITFRGDLPLMYQWLWFALTTNFGNFSEWLGNAIGGVSKLTKAGPSQPILEGSGQ